MSDKSDCELGAEAVMRKQDEIDELKAEVGRLSILASGWQSFMNMVEAVIDTGINEDTPRHEYIDKYIIAWEKQKKEIERLTAELATEVANYQAYVDGVDHAMDAEVKKLQSAAISAHSVLGAPRDGVSDERRAEVFTELNKALGGQDAILDILAAQAAKEK